MLCFGRAPQARQRHVASVFHTTRHGESVVQHPTLLAQQRHTFAWIVGDLE